MEHYAIVPGLSEYESIKKITSYKLISFYSCLLKGIIKENDNHYIIEEYTNMVAYKMNDTISLIINYYHPCIKIIIINEAYKVIVQYTTDVGGTFPEGEFGGTFFQPKAIDTKLIVDREKIEIGDTVCGVFRFESEIYRYKSVQRQDVFSGIFKIVIYNKDHSMVNDFSRCE